MIHRDEILRDDRGIIVLQSWKVSHLLNILNRFSESPKLKIWMSELCTFSQIRSQLMLRDKYYISLTDYQTCEITTIIIPLSDIYLAWPYFEV